MVLTYKRCILLLAVMILGISIPLRVVEAKLEKKTIREFDQYIQAEEKKMSEFWKPEGPFLWTDKTPGMRDRVKNGETIISRVSEDGGIEINNGLIHDWIGTVFVPDATMASTLHVLQDFDNHENIYKEVIDSKLLESNQNVIRGFHRYRKKKIITVVLDVIHEATYVELTPNRQYCRSYSRQIHEIDNAGEKDEKEVPENDDHGFLWRMNAYWKIEATTDGAFIECRSISLTRDVPTGLGWIIKPFIQNMPRESLIKTLEATKDSIRQKQ